MIFKFHMNENQKSINLEHIGLPDIPTVQLYRGGRLNTRPLKKASYGLVEEDRALLFYQIDYFGDVFVLEWSPFGGAEWIRFAVEGDQFESWMISSNRDLSTHETTNTSQEARRMFNPMIHNRRCHLPTGFLLYKSYKPISEPSELYLYYCRFQLEARICTYEYELIFCTWKLLNRPIWQNITLMTSPDASILLIKEYDGFSKSLHWDQVIVGQVPTLLQLACEAFNKRKRSTVGRIVEKLAKKLARKKETPRVEKKFTENKSVAWPPPRVLPTVSDSELREILKKIGRNRGRKVWAKGRK